jgi:hypothetical protein
MNRLILKLLATIIALWMTTAAFALDVPLTYARHPDEGESFRPGGTATLQSTLDRPSGEWKLPQLTSKQPIYAFAQLGDKNCLFILDRREADDFFYNRLYFDANGNKDLTDDPVIDGSFTVRNDGLCEAEFPPVDTKVDLGGRLSPYSFCLDVTYFCLDLRGSGRPDREISRDLVDNFFHFRLVANCSYSGKFDLEGQTYRVFLGDGNVNGRFDDKLTVSRGVETDECSPQLEAADHFYLTSGKEIGVYDVLPCGNLLMVNSRLFEINISTAESRMTLTSVTENLAPLKLAMAVERIGIYTEDGENCVMMYRPATEALIPKGRYRLLHYTALRKDAQGDEWLLAAQATERSPSATVRAGSSGVFNFGEPYLPVVEVPGSARQDVRDGAAQVGIAFTVEGAGKERLGELTRVSGNRTRIPLSEENPNRPKEPTYKVIQPDGQIVAQGSFEYG